MQQNSGLDWRAIADKARRLDTYMARKMLEAIAKAQATLQ